MKNRMGIIFLILICVGLAVALIWSQKQSADQKNTDTEHITHYSNDVVKISGELDEQRNVNTELKHNLDDRTKNLAELTNQLTDVRTTLSKTEESLKSTQDEMTREVAKRDAKIADLETQNQALDQRAIDLSTSITNLTTQIDETKRRLAASEGDKEVLTKELSRLIAEKAELEHQFNDLAVLRTQVAKLKEELSIARRIEWIRQGLFAAAEQKGAEKLMQPAAFAAPQPKPQPRYDLNVEVSADGTVRVIPPLTNNPAATNPAPAK